MIDLSLPYWSIPLGLTVLIWVVVSVLPLPRSRGDYDFLQPIIGLFHLACGVIATLVVWLVYFIVV